MAMRKRRHLLTIVPFALGALALAGCDEQEQGRILRYDKGVYLGQPDPALAEQQVEELRQRTRLQQGI
ncbi:MAG: hypothetical protein ACFCUQ_10235 [Kiloniellales bacterium]